MLPADLDLSLVLLIAAGGCAAGWIHTRVVLRRLKRELREDKERWWRYASAERAASLTRMRDLLDQQTANRDDHDP